jgi:2-polyprenyl-3-methyl-5-hydroxy-6-metoxy-1,4-benzoquinol methylase
MKRIVIQEQNEHGNVESSFDYFMKLNIPKTARILDVGCSYGSFIYNLHKSGYQNVYGIDISAAFVDTGKTSYKEISQNILLYSGKQIPFSGESFDVVLMFDVIEHIPEVKGYLKNEVYRVLKKGGIFIFQTPNKYINILWQIINQRSLVKWKTSDHCSLQTKNTLEDLLMSAGFQNPIIETNNLLTEHNRIKVKRRLWIIGLLLLYLLQVMPLSLTPNLWGYSRKLG